jgi:hypothetical protein
MRLADEQTAIVQRLERTGGCNSEAVDLLNNLRELLAARERRLARVLIGVRPVGVAQRPSRRGYG